MILNRALYELGSSEANRTTENTDVLRRQIVLEIDPIRTVYISWTWGRELEKGDRCYSLGYRAQSYFPDPAFKVLDVSYTPIWRTFIGNPIELSYIDDEYQVLRLKNGPDSIYCHTFAENAIRIGTNDPRKN
jgi:hypothetical protein